MGPRKRALSRHVLQKRKTSGRKRENCKGRKRTEEFPNPSKIQAVIKPKGRSVPPLPPLTCCCCLCICLSRSMFTVGASHPGSSAPGPQGSRVEEVSLPGKNPVCLGGIPTSRQRTWKPRKFSHQLHGQIDPTLS